MADLTLAVAQSHAEAPHQTGYSTTLNAKRKRKSVQSIAQKFDPDQPRDEQGQWAKFRTHQTTGRTLTSEEGYQWHEKGPGAEWAKAMPHGDQRALDSYAGFGYREVNELRRGKEPTREGKIRGLTPQEYAAVQAAPSGEAVQKMIPPEGPEFRYGTSYEYAKDVPSGPDKLAAHWAVVGPKVDPERLVAVTEEANKIDELIAHRGLVLNEPLVVERGAYLPGVTFEQLQNMQYEGPNGEPPAVWEEKGFTSTMLGEAGGRAKSYPALGKWESLYQRFHDIAGHQDEVGTAVRFHITLPESTKVASVEAARRLRYDFPKKPIDKPVPADVDPKYWVESDFSKTPTVDTRELEKTDQRTESEILLGSGARFRITKVTRGYTYHTSDPTLKPVQVAEVHMEYVGGGSSDPQHVHKTEPEPKAIASAPEPLATEMPVEVPAPLPVDVTPPVKPTRRVIRDVIRDERGLITQIIERVEE